MGVTTALNLLSILGGIGFVVAGLLAYFQFRDYIRPLRLLITYLDCQPTGTETSLILLRISLVNHSSTGRIVYDIDVTSKTDKSPLIELIEEVDPNLQNVTYSLPNVSRRLPFDEVLQFPLDIPPHQSQSKWKAIAMGYQGVAPISGTILRFRATALKKKYKLYELGRKGYKQGKNVKVLAETEIILFPAKRLSKATNIYRENM